MNASSVAGNYARLAVNKSLLKEYTPSGSFERIVYMNNGTEFQIQLFNPKQTKISAEIKVNGQSIGQPLVLRPGERVWLERYIDDSRKFLFSTYEVEDTKEVQNAIANNGVVEISFYDEVLIKRPILFLNDSISISAGQPSWMQYTTTGISGNVKLKSSSRGMAAGPLNENTYDANVVTSSAIGAASKSYQYSGSLGMVTEDSASLTSDINCLYSAQAPDTIETGTVEKGGHSNQQFGTVEFQQACFPFRTEKIHVLPSSRKPVTADDCYKKYCSACGRKLSRKFKFCPNCGEKI